MRWQAAAPLAASLLVGACSLGPDFLRPAVDVPGHFDASSATAAAAWPAQGWWANFGSPELDGLIERARVYNNDLNAAVARVIQADAQVRVSGAPLLPSVNGTGSYSYNRTGIGSRQLSSSFGSAGPYFDSRSYSVGLSASYDLDLFGRNRALLAAAKATAVATRFDQETVALSVVSSVASTYFQLLSAQDRLRVAERNLQSAEQILGAYRARLTVGTANLLDVSQQEALVAGQRASLPALRNTIEQNRSALGILVGLPPERLNISGGSLEALPVPVVAPGLPSELLARRPDVAFAEAQLRAENANIRAARAAFYPDITLTASGGLTSAALSALTGPGTLVTQVAASLLQPIFDNGLRTGQLELAKGRYAELLSNYRQSVLQAFTDVEQALTGLHQLTEQERLERIALQVAQRSAAIANAQLQAGTIDIITSLNTQTTLYNDLDLLTQIRLSRFQYLLNLYKALGGGFTVEGGIV
ncbi:MAG: efflux transporter outer membrane subunit [Acetobacteraceae bacterium]|nr:efflux transporter outer membrane subunit [Acetobacteraceae bacterium]